MKVELVNKGDEHYCSVIIERWQNFTGKKAELISDQPLGVL